MELPFLDGVIAREIPRWKNDVHNKDKDKVIVIDGREGSGKSALAQQLAIHLDPNFNIDKLCFTAEEFMNKVKDPKIKKGDCIILDEAFLAANSRSAMSSINKAMVGLATEMRQLNLFVIVCLPSFFDLDKYFSLWRTDLLIHTYFDKKGNRGRYILFGANKKKELYLKGKKFYNYGMVKSPYPPCRFKKGYTVDEEEYRKKKSEAFRKGEPMTRLGQRYKDKISQIIISFKNTGKTWDELADICNIPPSTLQRLAWKGGVKPPTPENHIINTNLSKQPNLAILEAEKAKF